MYHSRIDLSISVSVSRHFCLDFICAYSLLANSLRFFVPEARHFHLDFAIFDLAITVLVVRHFRFDLVIFSQQLHFCSDLLN